MIESFFLYIVAAFPFAAIGFLRYNGMTAEQFIWAWIKSMILTPRVLTIGNCNYYYDMASDAAKERKSRKRFHRRGTRQKRKPVKGSEPKAARKSRKRIDTKEEVMLIVQDT